MALNKNVDNNQGNTAASLDAQPIDLSTYAPGLGSENHVSGESSERRQHTHQKLTAEKIFDTAVYGVWNYGLQAGTSVAASIWFQQGGGKPLFEKSQELLGKHVFEKITNKTGAAAAAEARAPLLFLSLITVGNLFVPPMQYAEKHKAHYVSKINDWLNKRREVKGDAPDAEELAQQKVELEAIANQPLQSSKELWTGRALGLGANFVAAWLIGDKNNKAAENVAAEAVSGVLNNVGLKSLGNAEMTKTVTRMAFLDYGYSMISSNIMYVYGHYINPPKHKDADEKILTTEQPDSHVSIHDIKSAAITQGIDGQQEISDEHGTNKYSHAQKIKQAETNAQLGGIH